MNGTVPNDTSGSSPGPAVGKGEFSGNVVMSGDLLKNVHNNLTP